MDFKTNLLKKELLKELYFNKSLSVSHISLLINRSLPITQKILNDLISEGFITEVGFAVSTGGRKPQMYSLKENELYIISVAMDQLVTKIALLDLHNNIIGSVKIVNLALSDNKNALKNLIDCLKDFIQGLKISEKNIIGIGIGMPGFIDTNLGLNYSFLESTKSINESISEAVGLHVTIDNDSSLIALAELKFGLARNKKNVMIINIGWGIGLGLILNGSMFRGNNGFAGEFSHIALFPNNKLCSCGKTGCLETETSLLAIVAKARQGLNDGRTSILKDKLSNTDNEEAFKLISMAAQNGDRFAIELISKAAYDIGHGVSILIHILNPELIVLSGRGAQAGKTWKAPIQQAINEYTIPRLAAHTEVEISKIADQAELIGAAALVMENFEKFNLKYLESGLRTYENNK